MLQGKCFPKFRSNLIWFHAQHVTNSFTIIIFINVDVCRMISHGIEFRNGDNDVFVMTVLKLKWCRIAQTEYLVVGVWGTLGPQII